MSELCVDSERNERKIEKIGYGLRKQLEDKYIKRYGKSPKGMEDLLQFINYDDDEDKFSEFYFAMFTASEAREGKIPDEALRNARQEQIEKISTFALRAMGEQIVKFSYAMRNFTIYQLQNIYREQQYWVFWGCERAFDKMGSQKPSIHDFSDYFGTYPDPSSSVVKSQRNNSGAPIPPLLPKNSKQYYAPPVAPAPLQYRSDPCLLL